MYSLYCGQKHLVVSCEEPFMGDAIGSKLEPANPFHQHSRLRLCTVIVKTLYYYSRKKQGIPVKLFSAP